MSAALALGSLVVALALLWAGIRKLSFATPLAAVLSILDLVALVVAAATLGVWGWVVLVGANVVGFLVWGVVAAATVESELSLAASHSGHDVAELKRVVDALGTRDELRSLGQRERAHLVALIADRARTPAEIEVMAAPIASLWIAHQPGLAWLVDSFDMLLRLYGREADEAVKTADQLTVATQNSAATLLEMMDAMIVAAGGAVSEEVRAA